MGPCSGSKIQKRKQSNKSISKRSRKTALEDPRTAATAAFAAGINSGFDDTDRMDYVYPNDDIISSSSSERLNTPIQNSFCQLGALTNDTELIANIDPQLISLNSSVTYTESDVSQTVLSSNCSAETSISSPAASTFSEHIESDSSMTPARMNKNGVYRPDGVTLEDIDGNLYWRDTDTDEWKAAIRHSDIRDQLIADCAREGRYLYHRECGSLPNDITAFHKGQENWGFERHQRPEILFQYERAGYKNPTYCVPLWVYNGFIVLDHEHHPILAFRNMPATISTKVEGGLQEAISREDSRIDVKDFRARMMANARDDGSRKSALPSLSAISMRRSRFRWRAGLLSWTTRTGSQDIKDYLDSLLPDICKISNSTKGFRDLKKSEVKLMSEKNRGKHLKRAGARSISAEKRMEMDKAFYKSIADAKAYEKFEAKEQQNLRFQDDDETESDGLEDEDCEVDGLQDDDYLLEDEVLEITDLRDYNPENDTVFDGEMHPPSHDFRFAQPLSAEEIQIVFYSLQPTRIQIYEMTKMVAPLHDMYQSYAKQWASLEEYLVEIWKRSGLPGTGPALVQSKRHGWVNRFPRIEQRWINEAERLSLKMNKSR